MFCKRSPLKLLNKIYEKYLRKSSFLVKLQVLKKIHSHMFFKVFAKSLSNLVHVFWEDCFHNQKLLLAVNRVIYLNNINMYIKNSRSPVPLRTIVFLNRITISGETASRHLFHEVENAASFAKIIIICENNYSR